MHLDVKGGGRQACGIVLVRVAGLRGGKLMTEAFAAQFRGAGMVGMFLMVRCTPLIGFLE